MRRKQSIFYNAILLTAVHLLLRLSGTSFQVYLSGRIGASGIGLLQLTLSAGNFAMVMGMAGIRTSCMYLTAEELGRGQNGSSSHALSACIRYSLITSLCASALLIALSSKISGSWIGNTSIRTSLFLFAAFLPIVCQCGVLTGHFTASGRIRTLAAVEVAEQFFTMGITIILLHAKSRWDSVRACECVILGSGIGSSFTLTLLLFLQKKTPRSNARPKPIAGHLLETAVPLALADMLKAGISTLENMMVPKRLAMNRITADPLAAFGVITGMVFPILMLPASILFALADLLIPELARCNTSHSHRRIRYLVSKGIRIAMIYGVLVGGIVFLSAQSLCNRLYSNAEAGIWLRRYTLFIPMLYCDALVDAMTKGLGQQRVCVRYNILTNTLDVLLLFLLLPSYGMNGYWFSFFITHLLNFTLSYRRLLKITGIRLSFSRGALCCMCAVISVGIAQYAPVLPTKLLIYPILLFSGMVLLGVLGKEDFLWLKGILIPQGTPAPAKKPPNRN